MSEAIARFQQVRAAIEADRAIDIAQAYAAIVAAADAGDPQARLFEAYATGIGYGCDIDIPQAFELLSIADEAGAPQATPQVDLIGTYKDVDAWIASRPIRDVHTRPRITMSDAFIDEALCNWLIERGRPLQEQSLVYDPSTGQPIQDASRTNSAGSFKLSDLDMPTILLRQRIANTIGVDVRNFERTSVFRYEAGQTFGEHADYISLDFSAEIRQRGQRPYTFLIYLNDDYEGGETHFLTLGKKLRGKAGDAIFWRNVGDDGAPDEVTLHAGDPPTRGEKWLLSQFIRDKAQLPG
ncbi:prolyl hydroxylase family protein [Candidatus Viadribacter manganicus]|uniref:Fe2OG dioxygenase domain-containing protein n=1 Tax=Candidatus Viadribacter manganicus TaxID=1759059 RepID=A0A1B1AEK9_9PROT|nr:2OG-Fe(II) oxygenase [Candidatus Viadribacter manganicus]ANP44991.1 hypothetical protein ATE48_03160 [Candidatus Viadribacter manganicus]